MVGYQSTDGTDLDAEFATGACHEVSANTSSRVMFSAVDMGIPRLTRGYAINGTEIVLTSDGIGTVTLGGRAYDLFAFNDFSCGRNCTDADNWRGLSVALWDGPARRLACAGLYLSLPDGPVSLTSPITLPGFTGELDEQAFDAAFTLP